MRQIDDSFESPNGSWGDYWTPYGFTDNGWINAVSHVDLRSFINLDIERLRTQEELDQYTQTVLGIDPPLGTQANLESKRVVAGEFWQAGGTGISPSPSWVNYPTWDSYPRSLPIAGWWRLEEDSGTTFADEIGTNDGTSSGSPTLGGVGLVNDESDFCVIFDGVDDYITVPHSSSLNPATVTVCGWVKLSDTTSFRTMVDTISGNYGFRLAFNTGTPYVAWGTGSSVQTLSSSLGSISTDWAFVLAVLSASGVNLYVNGVLAATSATAYAPATSGGLKIGATQASSSNKLVGKIDEVQVYTGALLVDEIRTLHAIGRGQLFKVGLIGSPANIRAITATAIGGAIDADMVSSIYVDSDPVTSPIDCSDLNVGESAHLVLTFDSTADILLSDLTAASSYVQLSSNTDGSFASANQVGDAPEDGESAKVAFSATEGGTHWLALPMSAFERDSFDPTHVTGIRIHVEAATAALGDELRLLHGVRVVEDITTYQANDRKIDFDTRHKTIMNQVALDGSVITDALPKLVRASVEDSENDPVFVDGSFGVHFSTGGGLVQAGTNSIDLIVREGPIFAATETHIVARLSWDDNGDAFYRVFRYDGNEGTGSIVAASDTGTVDWGITLTRAQDEDLLAGRGIDIEAGRYYFEVSAIGSLIELRLRSSNALNVAGDLLAQVSLPSVYYKARSGRCGFSASFVDYDAYIDELVSGTIGYGTIRTSVFKSPTPVDGVQLIANATPDVRLTQDVFWVDVREKFIDMEKSPSKRGSFRTKSGLVTSNFLIGDWKHSYIKMLIWVDKSVTFANQPYIIMESVLPDEDDDPIKFRINLERLQPSQWNEVYIDLLPYRNDYANLFYRLSILVPQDGGLGTFWVDDLFVGQRTIEWEAKANSDGIWRSFRGLVNDPFGGIHFPPEERGRELQIQGTALVPSARIVNYKVIPRYAQLGTPLYDRSYRTR